MENDNEIQTAEEFAQALTDVARRVLENEDFRQLAMKNPAEAIREASGKNLPDGVVVTMQNCTRDLSWASRWPENFPEPGEYDVRLPTKPRHPHYTAQMGPLCMCPPFTNS